MEKVKAELRQNTPNFFRYHLKDIERTLYAKIEQHQLLKTKEKKKFVRFSDDPKLKGIIVVDEQGMEESIECDFVFDCTGSSRSLVKEVNAKIKPEPFTIKAIFPEVRVRNNFLAYVTMPPNDFKELYTIYAKTREFLPKLETPLTYVHAMEKLRALGWKEFGFPRFYGVNFEKNKVCLYMEAPDNLPETLYSDWVHALTKAITGNDITFQELPKSKTYGKKPRFNSFYVDPQVVEQVAFEKKGFPTVILAGDSQIEPHFALAHGLKSGMERVDLLIEHIEELNKTIAYFDAGEYAYGIKEEIQKHKENVIEYYNARNDYFSQWLTQAEIYYAEAIKQTPDLSLQKELTRTLEEIRLRIKYREANLLVAEFYKNLPVSWEHIDLGTLQSKFAKLIDLYKAVLSELPEECSKERTIATEHLKRLADTGKELGAYYFKKQQFSTAEQMYQNSLTIHQHLLLKEQGINVLTFLSNQIICHRKMNKGINALKLVQIAFTQYPLIAEAEHIQKKIAYNGLSALAEELSKIPRGTTELIISANASERIKLHDHLIQLSDFLSSLASQLTPTFAQERAMAAEQLETIAGMWKELGAYYFNQKNFGEAEKMYEASLSIRQHPLCSNQDLAQLTLHSNLLLCKRKSNNGMTALRIAQDALTRYAETPETETIRFKIAKNAQVELTEQLKTLHAALNTKESAMNAADITSHLSELSILLKTLSTKMLPAFANEHAALQDNLHTLAGLLKQCGSRNVQEQNFVDASKLYQHSIETYQNPLLETDSLSILVLLSNQVICKRKLKESGEAIAIAIHALRTYPTTLESKPFKQKILGNAITEMVNQAKTAAPSDLPELKKALQKIVKEQAELLDPKMRKELQPYLGTSVEFLKEVGFFSASTDSRPNGKTQELGFIPKFK